MKIKSMVLVFALMAVFSGCGGSGSGTPADNSTRTLSGTLSDSGSQDVSPSKSGAIPAAKSLSSDSCIITGYEICRVIATATDATTVSDTTLSDCGFSLGLSVGKRYVISFVGANGAGTACDEFVATLLASSGAVFNISSGSAIDFGNVFIGSDGTATFSSSEDAMSGIIESCAELGYDDIDMDGVCDWSDDALPTGPGEAAAACASDTDCAGGESCSLYGYCEEGGYRVCQADADCGAGYACSGSNLCVLGTPSGLALTEIEGWYVLNSATGCTDNDVIVEGGISLDVYSAGTQLMIDEDAYSWVNGCEADAMLFTTTVVGETFEVDDVIFTDEVCLNPANAGTTSKLTFSLNESSTMQVVREITNSASSTQYAPVGCSLVYVEHERGPIILQGK